MVGLTFSSEITGALRDRVMNPIRSRQQVRVRWAGHCLSKFIHSWSCKKNTYLTQLLSDQISCTCKYVDDMSPINTIKSHIISNK